MKVYCKETGRLETITNAIDPRSMLDYTRDLLGNHGVNGIYYDDEYYYALDTMDDVDWWDDCIRLINIVEQMLLEIERRTDPREFDAWKDRVMNEIGSLNLYDHYKELLKYVEKCEL
jgi:hypothetical protein